MHTGIKYISDGYAIELYFFTLTDYIIIFLLSLSVIDNLLLFFYALAFIIVFFSCCIICARENRHAFISVLQQCYLLSK